MISNPRSGQSVQAWYKAPRKKPPKSPTSSSYGVTATDAQYHGKVGTVVVRGNGKPRNHGVIIDGILVFVPAGNLREPLS